MTIKQHVGPIALVGKKILFSVSLVLLLKIIEQFDIFLKMGHTFPQFCYQILKFSGVEFHGPLGNPHSNSSHYLSTSMQFRCEVVDFFDKFLQMRVKVIV